MTDKQIDVVLSIQSQPETSTYANSSALTRRIIILHNVTLTASHWARHTPSCTLYVDCHLYAVQGSWKAVKCWPSIYLKGLHTGQNKLTSIQ